jgi:hypothetical protein
MIQERRKREARSCGHAGVQSRHFHDTEESGGGGARLFIISSHHGYGGEPHLWKDDHPPSTATIRLRFAFSIFTFPLGITQNLPLEEGIADNSPVFPMRRRKFRNPTFKML